MASYVVCNLKTCLCAHHLWLPVIFLLMSCILGFVHVFLLHLCLCPLWVSLHFFLSLGCAWITDLLRIVVVLICTGFLCCIHKCVILSFVVCGIGSPHPFQRTFTISLWPVIMLTSWKKEKWLFFSRTCIMLEPLLWYKYTLCFCSGQVLACECYWLQCYGVSCFILWKLYSIPCLQKTCSETNI